MATATANYYGHNAAQDTLYKLLFTDAEQEGVAKAVTDVITTQPAASDATTQGATNKIEAGIGGIGGISGISGISGVSGIGGSGGSGGNKPSANRFSNFAANQYGEDNISGAGLPGVVSKGAKIATEFGINAAGGLGPVGPVLGSIVEGVAGSGLSAKKVGSSILSVGLSAAGVPGLLTMALKALGVDPLDMLTKLTEQGVTDKDLGYSNEAMGVKIDPITGVKTDPSAGAGEGVGRTTFGSFLDAIEAGSTNVSYDPETGFSTESGFAVPTYDPAAYTGPKVAEDDAGGIADGIVKAVDGGSGSSSSTPRWGFSTGSGSGFDSSTWGGSSSSSSDDDDSSSSSSSYSNPASSYGGW